ncbi:PAS domain-containing protein, partial [Roseomonas mucosa]
MLSRITTEADPWPFGGGDTGALVREPGFEASGLGPVTDWPASLRTIAEMVFNSRQPKFVAWGPDLAFLYNDAYTPIFAERHPWALGRPFAEVWADIWPQFGPIVDRTLSGDAQYYRELPIPMLRQGRREETWFTFSYTPLRDESGQIAGLVCAAMEVTDQVLGRQREQAALKALQQQTETLATVNRAGIAITSELDVGRLTQLAVDAGISLTGAEFGAFFYNAEDETGQDYRLYALSGADAAAFASFPMPRATPLFSPDFAGRTVIRSDDVTRD